MLILPPRKLTSVLMAVAMTLALQSAVLLGDLLPASGAALAADDEEEEPRFQGKKVQQMSPAISKIMNKVVEYLDAENYAAAKKELDKAKAVEKKSAYDMAQIYSFSGYVNFETENYRGAMADFKKVLEQPELPDSQKQQAYRALAQLSFVIEDFDSALKYADGYLTEVGPDATMYAVKGQAYYEKGDYNRMIAPVEQAIKMTEEAGEEPKEGWWQLLRLGYWEKENYTKVRDIMEILVSNWPKKTYWLQLGAVYSQLDDEPRQLAAYEAAYDQGMLDSSSELMTLGQLLVNANAPYKGAKVIEKGLADGKIEKTTRNLRTLAQAWQMAQEDRKALDPLNQAASLSDDGELYVKLAYSYLNLSEYDKCVDASNKAINKGGVKNQGDTYIVMGKCQFEKKSYTNAKTAFQNAAKYKDSKKTADQWLVYVAGEQDRLKQLEDSLKQLERGNKAQAEVPAIEEEGVPVEAT